ncbi:hypothetical protein [Nocardioides bruguierae]|uniref:Uncharacterized protein n=1 Tax=Nocardioides bruguierae TaxID=2945102 RepID=A0A9X2DAX6_9ACTN|nr:hypothetical protein [Nocardioides bruguierae]MCM0622340.1 hypothetical protein [Nocardioides bruguierae]
MAAKREINLTKAQLEQIKQALDERSASGLCLRCGKAGMLPMNRLMSFELQTVASAISGAVREVTVPAAMLVCPNCGHLDFHALGMIGLLQMKPGEDHVGETPERGDDK